jgi:hypothetical protein
VQLWRIDEDDVSPVETSTFESEKELQDLIERNPEILPIDADLMILAREFQCGSGAADFVAVDMQTGQLVIVETKLYRNGSRRRVVAQVLDYAADMFDQDLEYLEQRVPVSAWEELDGTAQEVLADSLREGDFRLVIVMDQVDDSVSKVARYFQSAGVKFKIDLVTVSLATLGGTRFVCAHQGDGPVSSRPLKVRTEDAEARAAARVDRRKAMIALRDQGFSQAEIARQLGVSEATVSREIRK